MRNTVRVILNAVSLAANLLAGICLAFYIYILASTPPDLDSRDAEGPAMLSGISGSFALLLLAVAALLGVICVLVARRRIRSVWASGRASLIVSLILGSVLGSILLYINLLA